MEDATWSQVVAAARAIGSVNLTGYGENAMHPKFVAMLRELDDAGVRTSFATNGIPMHDKLVAALAGLRHLECVNVSIDSPDPEIYRQIRGGDVQRALQGLERLARAVRPRTRVTVSSVVMDSNVESLVAFPDILARLGIDTYVLQGLHDRTFALADRDVRRHPNGLALLALTQTRCRELGLDVRIEAGDTKFAPMADLDETHFSEQHTRQCIAPWTVPFIDRSGRVFPCCLGDETAVMGQLGEATLGEIWSGPTFRKFRADLIGGRDLPSVCRSCTAIKRLGPHPFRFAGAIDDQRSQLRGSSNLRLTARNTGVESWNRRWPLAIGKVGDGASARRLPSWASESRIQYMKEAEVPPGGDAVFEFEIARPVHAIRETFALVVEGVTWLDDTQFELPQAHQPNRSARPRTRLRDRFTSVRSLWRRR